MEGELKGWIGKRRVEGNKMYCEWKDLVRRMRGVGKNRGGYNEGKLMGRGCKKVDVS